MPTPVSPYLWLAGFVVLLMVLIFIAWILAELVLPRLEPGTDDHKIVKWWTWMLAMPVAIIGYALPVIGGAFLAVAIASIVGHVIFG